MTSPDPTAAVDYSELSAAALAKLINDEYSVILSSERINLQRAQAIGEKLIALRAGAKHGEWQKKLEKWCPKVSYETANNYVKLWEQRDKLMKNAAAKSVAVTDLTIRDALALLRTPKKTNTETDSDGNARKSVSATLGAVEPPLSDEDGEAVWLKNLAVDELIILLREVCGTEYLQELYAALAKALQPEHAETTQAAAAAAAAATPSSAIGRRM